MRHRAQLNVEESPGVHALSLAQHRLLRSRKTVYLRSILKPFMALGRYRSDNIGISKG